MLAVIAEARELWNQSGIENYRTSVRVDLPNESDWKPVWIESEVRGDENRQLSLVPPSPGDEVELFRLADQFSVDPTIEPAYGRDNDATVESWFMFLEQHVLYHVWLGPPDETAANNPEIDDWVLAGFTEPITFHPTHGYPTRFAAHWWMSFAEYSLERFDLLGSAAPACSTSGRTVSTSPTDVSPAADLTRSLVLEALSSCDPLLLQATYDYLKPAADDDLSVHFAGDSGGRTLTMLFDALSGEPEVRDGLLRWNPSREGDPVVRIEASGRWDIGRRS